MLQWGNLADFLPYSGLLVDWGTVLVKWTKKQPLRNPWSQEVEEEYLYGYLKTAEEPRVQAAWAHWRPAPGLWTPAHPGQEEGKPEPLLHAARSPLTSPRPCHPGRGQTAKKSEIEHYLDWHCTTEHSTMMQMFWIFNMVAMSYTWLLNVCNAASDTEELIFFFSILDFFKLYKTI